MSGVSTKKPWTNKKPTKSPRSSSGKTRSTLRSKGNTFSPGQIRQTDSGDGHAESGLGDNSQSRNKTKAVNSTSSNTDNGAEVVFVGAVHKDVDEFVKAVNSTSSNTDNGAEVASRSSYYLNYDDDDSRKMDVFESNHPGFYVQKTLAYDRVNFCKRDFVFRNRSARHEITALPTKEQLLFYYHHDDYYSLMIWTTRKRRIRGVG